MSIQTDSTFWSPNDDRMLDIWVEHGYPESNDVVHLVDACVRLRNIARQWQGIANEFITATGAEPEEITAPEWDQLSLLPDREGTPSDQTGGAS